MHPGCGQPALVPAHPAWEVTQPPCLPAEHEGPISSVRLSPNGLRVLSTTSSGHLGFLDIPSREYNVLVRSHTALVLGLATECNRGQLATVSQDHTVRVWDLATLQQVECCREGKTREPQTMLRPGGQGPGRWGAGEDLWCPLSCGLCWGSSGSGHLKRD